MRLARKQLDAGRCFICENPQSATSWAQSLVKIRLGMADVSIVVAHHCQFGAGDLSGNPGKTPTRFMTNSINLVEKLNNAPTVRFGIVLDKRRL